MRAFGCFYSGDMRGLPAINKAMVSLLPKVDGAIDIKDFRPVSLVHGAIKIFDKVLFDRLAEELPGLVGLHQRAFVRGRSLHDNFMLIQGMARKLHALKEPSIMLKLDITKAFDSVQWPFLLEMLRSMGFGDKWLTWICGPLGTTSTRVAFNGVPGRIILNCKGLRQGDPVSPMLFILIMEPLQRMFELATAHGLLSPLAPRGMKHRVSMFADDVMIFIKPKDIELRTCYNILDLFGCVSGLRVNLLKSAAIPIRCLADDMAAATATFGCPTGSFPCKYLGLPLTIRKQSAHQLQGLVDQLAAQLPTWRVV